MRKEMAEETLQRNGDRRQKARERYLGSQRTLKDIAGELGLSRATLSKWKREEGWERPGEKGKETTTDQWYEAICFGELTGEERALLRVGSLSPRERLEREVLMYTLREKRILDRIQEGHSDPSKQASLEQALTRVQAGLHTALMAIHKMDTDDREENQREEGEIEDLEPLRRMLEGQEEGEEDERL